MLKFQDKSMWTEEHWRLFNTMESCYREYFEGEKFGSNFPEFKKHMLYILGVMEAQYEHNSNKEE